MRNELTRFEALICCRDIAGNDSKLARDLGVTQPRAWRWLNQTKQLPGEYVLCAEKLYGVSRHDLRPDIYPRNYPPAPEAEPDLEIRFHGTDNGSDRRMHLAERRVA
ncbi:YdaS family helix-turn-helix protein [Parasphingorhabdus sp.]|uniref:YdaS family helix-turn-helix protein n=1 Tax=Parasphingorhabdus sp. TaxID=2709688 RepID=UPI002F92DC74